MLAYPKKLQPILPEMQSTRRGFLLGAAAVTGGFAVGFRPGPAAAQGADAASPFDAYLTVGSDDTVTVISSQFEMGQGSYNGVATLVVEELGARWDQVDVLGGSGNTALYGNLAWGGVAQGSGGSTSMATSWDRYRMAGAAARAMLIAAAAEAWGVPAEDVTVADGVLRHATAGSLRFGEVAARAAEMPVPSEVALKEQSDWTVIGDPDLRRYDSVAKTNGTHDFTIDVTLPGMLTAVMIHPPKFGATVASFDAEAAKALPGVVDVVETPRGIAVLGEHMWATMKGREAVMVQWDESTTETRGSDDILAEYRDLAAGAPQAIARQNGDTASAMETAAQVIEAAYGYPYLAHAAMEPLNAIAHMNEDGILEVWGGHQIPDLYQFVASQVAGTTPDKVRLHVMKTGGGLAAARWATPISSSKRWLRPARSAGRRRSRCSGRERTTCAAGAIAQPMRMRSRPVLTRTVILSRGSITSSASRSSRAVLSKV